MCYRCVDTGAISFGLVSVSSSYEVAPRSDSEDSEEEEEEEVGCFNGHV